MLFRVPGVGRLANSVNSQILQHCLSFCFALPRSLGLLVKAEHRSWSKMTWLTVSVDRKIIGILDYTTVHMSLAKQRVEVAILATLTWGENYKPQNTVQTYS